MTEHCYVAVKGSLYAVDACVFGLSPEEVIALSKRYSETVKEVINGVVIKANPIQVINSLGEIGYRVICSTGDAEIVWTLRREILDRYDRDGGAVKAEQPVGGRISPVAKEVVGGNRRSSSPQPTLNRPLQVRPGPALVSPIGATNAVAQGQASSRPAPPPPKKVERIGTRPEDYAKYAPESSKIDVRNLKSIEEIPLDQKVILKTNLSSEGNPLSNRNAQPTRLSQYQSTYQASIVQPAKDRVVPQVFDDSGSILNIINPISSMHPGACKTGASCCPRNAAPSTGQTLAEMDFERGIWNAALQGDKKRVGELLSKGADPNQSDNGGYTALHYAARQGHAAVCAMLLQAGADANAITRAGGSSPLHRAALAGHMSIIQMLLKSGGNPTMLDGDGRTALHRAVESGHRDAAVVLLQVYPKAAAVSDLHGRTPADLAQGNPLLEQLFNPRA